MATLDEAKNVIKEHLKKELKTMEMILLLNEKNAQDFKDWYINQPLVKGLEEIYGIMESRRMGHTKIERDSTIQLGQRNENKNN